MPFAVNDIQTSVYQKLDSFVRFTLRNPLAAALTLSLITCIIVIWLFRYDSGIKLRSLKMFKVFVYTFIVSTFILFLQNSYLLRDRSKPIGAVLGGDIISGNELAIQANKEHQDYVPPTINNGMYELIGVKRTEESH